MKAIALLALAVSLEAGFLFTVALPASHVAAAQAASRPAAQVRVVQAPVADPVRS